MFYNPIKQTGFNNLEYRQTVFPYRNPFHQCDQFFLRVSDYMPEVRDYFWVNQYGDVYNEKTGFLVTPNYNRNGYMIVSLRRKPECYDPIYGTKSSTVLVHRLVALAFIYPHPAGLDVINHKDCNPRNPYYQNLEWTSQKENIRYSLALGHYGEGETYVSSKNSRATIEKICELLQSGITDPSTISSIVFGKSIPTPAIYALIQSIRTGENWTSISKNYNIPDIEHRNFTDPNIIHAFCKYLESHPEEVHTTIKSANEILMEMGFDISTFTDAEYHRYRSALYQIKVQKAYKKIIAQYDIRF